MVFLGLLSGLSCVLAAQRPPWTSNRIVGSPNPPSPYTVERLFPSHTFDHPVDLALMPGTRRLVVAEQRGVLWSFDLENPSRAPAQLADLRAHHEPLDNVLGFAFHPGFATNHYLFINYNEPGGRTNGAIVSRFTVSSLDPPTIDPASERVIIQWLSGGHNGCTLAFGPEGCLYISTGDAADPDPPDRPYSTGQDIGDLLASILRIDVDREEEGRAYAIPRDNPFVNVPGARPEVWAFGLRNPYRMSFDEATGDLWVGDVGWEQWEMIYLARAGGNYGWSITEGPNLIVRTDVKPGPGSIEPPLVALPHSDAASITGGVVYHGSRFPSMKGAYVCGDWETGKFWMIRQAGGTLTDIQELCDTTLKPSAFARDADGEILILDYNGGLYGLVPNPAPPANLAFPRRLSETGLFADTAKQMPAAGVIPYRINAAMWSDHATADHLVGVPDPAPIVTAGGRETIVGRMWFYPSNTVFARTLTLEMHRGEASTARRIETQILHFEGQTWNGYTFRWNAEQTDADLVPAEGTNDVFQVRDAAAPDGSREIPWRFLSRAECLRCHNVWAGDTLSFNLPQLNTPGPVSELERLQSIGLLRVRNPPKPLPRLAGLTDAGPPLDLKARSWLHVNCAPCHRYGAGGGVPTHLNFEASIEQTRSLDAKPLRGDFGLAAPRVIAPGEPYRSTLYYRIGTEGAGHMPHIGSRLVDEAGVRLMRDWIRSLPRASRTDAEIETRDRNFHLEVNFLRNLGEGSGLQELPSGTGAWLAFLDACRFDASSGSSGEPRLFSPGGHLKPEIVDAVLQCTNGFAREIFQPYLPAAQRRRTLGMEFDPQRVLELTGNEIRGRDLYAGAAQCSRCHVCQGVGRSFGPELGGLAERYSRAQLLEQILDPSKVIPPEYRSVTLRLRDERELTGFIVRRPGVEWVLREELSGDRRLNADEVVEVIESSLSAMPEGLLAPLTAQEAADLLEFLYRVPKGGSQ